MGSDFRGGPRQRYHALPKCELFLNISAFFFLITHVFENEEKAVKAFNSFSKYSKSIWVEYLRKLSKVSKKKRGASNIRVTCAILKRYLSSGACPYWQDNQSGGARDHFMAVTYPKNSKSARASLLPAGLRNLVRWTQTSKICDFYPGTHWSGSNAPGMKLENRSYLGILLEFMNHLLMS